MPEPTPAIGLPDILDAIQRGNRLQEELIEVVKLSGGRLAGSVGAPGREVPQLSEAYLQKGKIARDCGGWLNSIIKSFATLAGPVNWRYKWGDVNLDFWDAWQTVPYPYTYEWEYPDSPGHTAYHYQHDDDEFRVKFDRIFYDPQLSKIVYGDPEVVDSVTAELKGQAFLIDLTGFNSDAEHRISRSETLKREVSHTMSEEFTSETSGEFGGSIPGTGFEAKVTETFGFKTDDSETKTMSTDVTQTIEDSIISPKRRKTLVYFDKGTQSIVTPFDINAILAIGFTMTVPPQGHHFEHAVAPERYRSRITRVGPFYWNERNRHGGEPQKAFPDLLAFDQFLHGTDPDYPAMAEYWAKVGHVNESGVGIADLFNPEKRRIQLAGNREARHDNTVTYKVADVTGQTDEDIERDHGIVTKLGPNDAISVAEFGAESPFWRFTGAPTLVVRECDGVLVKGAA